MVFLPPKYDLYPWKLGHVCSQWREILWSCSEIWSNIEIRTTRTRARSDHETRIWNILNEILARTNALIRLSIKSHRHSSDWISKLIQSFSSRCKGLMLCTISYDSLCTLLNLAQGSLNHLEELHFSVESSHSLHTLGPYNSVHPAFPSLRQLSTGIYSSSMLDLLFKFPLLQLTTISLTGGMVTPSIVHSCLQQCSALRFANFHFLHGPGEASDYRANVMITSNLECLEVVPFYAIDWDVILTPLILPSLRKLSTTGDANFPAGFSPIFAGAMAALIIRSKCSLHSFSIMDYDTDEGSQPLRPNIDPPHPSVMKLFQGTPTLTDFISEYVAHPALIRLVHSGWLPNLRNVRWKVKPAGLKALLDLLDDYISQRPLSSRFLMVHIFYCRGDGYSASLAHYTDNRTAYMDAGIDLTVQKTNSDPIRLADQNDSDSDAWDLDSDVSDSGWGPSEWWG